MVVRLESVVPVEEDLAERSVVPLVVHDDSFLPQDPVHDCAVVAERRPAHRQFVPRHRRGGERYGADDEHEEVQINEEDRGRKMAGGISHGRASLVFGELSKNSFQEQ